ncbi:sugar ABC transporter substrate-binding protein [Nonomuraea sp. H19]|uniref:sugar ABC transporter substrate-binding protein n=1 Tax=Nonomuraea sp. H19 TaxID=3452206 RepID=UPI003F8C9119
MNRKACLGVLASLGLTLTVSGCVSSANDSGPVSSAAPTVTGAQKPLGNPVAGIGWDSDMPTPSCDLSEKKVVYISVLRENPVLRIMAQGAVDGFDAFRMQGQWLAPQGFDEPGAVQLGDQAIAQGVDGIVVFATSDAFYPMIKRAKAAGIPVVQTHSPIEEGRAPGVLNVVAPDPAAYGAAAAQSIATALKAKGVTSGSVAVTQTALILNENQAAEAFTARMKELAPALKVLKPVAVGGDQEKAIAAETGIVQGNPDLVAAFGTYGNAPVTWATTQKDTGKKLSVIGMDYAKANLDNVKNGQILGVAAQPLYQEHYEGAVLLGNRLCGQTQGMKYRYSPPAPIITKDGLDPYYNLLGAVKIG